MVYDAIAMRVIYRGPWVAAVGRCESVRRSDTRLAFTPIDSSELQFT